MRVAGVEHHHEMVDVAKCFLKGAASTWINREEAQGTEFSNLDALEKALIEEYVPDNEDAQARSKLMRLQFKSNLLERHISQFRDLIELCGPHPGDAYNYFFMSLPDEYKAELAQRFPKGSTDLKAVYNFVRNLEVAQSWRAPSAQPPRRRSSNGFPRTSSRHTGATNSRTTTPQHDPAATSWGPCDKSNALERQRYRSSDRCMACGGEGWSKPTHVCDLTAKDSAGKPKN